MIIKALLFRDMGHYTTYFASKRSGKVAVKISEPVRKDLRLDNIDWNALKAERKNFINRNKCPLCNVFPGLLILEPRWVEVPGQVKKFTDQFMRCPHIFYNINLMSYRKGGNPDSHNSEVTALRNYFTRYLPNNFNFTSWIEKLKSQESEKRGSKTVIPFS